MSNSDRVVLVLGGAGMVGSGIVKGLLDKGKTTRGPRGVSWRVGGVHISLETILRMLVPSSLIVCCTLIDFNVLLTTVNTV